MSLLKTTLPDYTRMHMDRQGDQNDTFYLTNSATIRDRLLSVVHSVNRATMHVSRHFLGYRTNSDGETWFVPVHMQGTDKETNTWSLENSLVALTPADVREYSEEASLDEELKHYATLVCSEDGKGLSFSDVPEARLALQPP